MAARARTTISRRTSTGGATSCTVDLGIAAIKGMIEGGVILPPYDYFKLDTLDFRAWLSKYGAHDVSRQQPRTSAACTTSGSRCPARSAPAPRSTASCGCAGPTRARVMWKMQAGMGDTIFAPLYLVLKKRGVKFEFFSARRQARAVADGKRGSRRSRSASRCSVKTGEYDPLVPVKDLPCWPSEPQLRAARATATS